MIGHLRVAFFTSGDPVPERQIRADRHADYEHLARVMSVAARHGLGRIGFVTEPEPAR